MAFQTQQSETMADINVTPMVDVMLVLLIIFMVVTPALLTGFQAQLPQAVHLKERPEEDNRVTLGIDLDGRYYLNKVLIRREDALRLLTAQFEARPEDKVLFFKADKGVRYSEVLTAMRLARDAGARVVAAISEQMPGTESDAATP
ncbi:MAG: biopolymer transporter ExbD [Gemmatimonadetes bacterium]|nr:biopolymer transporter ExbD [Gemmatimonadota bacterium]